MPMLRFGSRRDKKKSSETISASLSAGSPASGKSIRTGSSTTNTDIAIRPREQDNYYLRESGNFFDVNEPDQLSQLRDKIRTYSIYNDTLAIATNLTAMFTVKGPRIQCDDDVHQEQLQAFFEDEDYEVFLQDFAKEYIISGEATSFAFWNDKLKCFSKEQILNPDGVSIEPSVFSENDAVVISVPETMASVIEDEDNPDHDDFIKNYKDIYDAYKSGRGLNVDSDKVIRVVNKSHPWDTRGYPFFTPALSALYQEDQLDAALYEQLSTLITPTIIGTVGLKAGELGPGSDPWIPTQSEMNEIKEAYKTMMMARFRLGLFNVAVHFENAFGNTNVPDLSKDYDRCEKKILRCVAAGQGLLDGSASGPFASNSINRDVYSSFLMSLRQTIIKAFQKRIDTFIHKTGMYMYRTNDMGKREQVLTDDGQPVFETAHLEFDNDIMKDANTLLNTALQLRNSNVPIANQTLADASGLGINVIDELRKVKDEKYAENTLNVDDAVAENNDTDGKPSPENVEDGTQGDVKSPLDKREM